MSDEFEIINTHAHVYPLKIAAKASEHVGAFYQIPMAFGEGTVEHLLAESVPMGVRKIVVHSVATAKEQVRSINRFLGGFLEHPLLHPFATLHPDMDEAELRAELDEVRAAGMHGIKLHPDCQQFSIAGRRGRRMLDAIGTGLPVLYHTGDRRYRFSNPDQMVAVAKDYPHVLFIAAHFGAYSEWEKAELYADVPNVVFDTSSSLAYISPERAVELIHGLGVERFMFATDYPMWKLEDEVSRVLALPLTVAERKAIFAGNARRLLGIRDV